MEMIDAVSPTGHVERGTEKYWRCLSKADRKAKAVRDTIWGNDYDQQASPD
jgi:hypothetical protein